MPDFTWIQSRVRLYSDKKENVNVSRLACIVTKTVSSCFREKWSGVKVCHTV